MVENVLLGLQIKKDNQQVFEKILHSYSTAGAFFQNVLNISLPERNAVEVYQRNNEASSIELSKRVKCLIFLANGGVEKKQQQEINVRIANGLKRAPYIRHAADIVVQQISDGSPYAVLHWRNKSGEFCRERTIHFCTEEMLDSLRILDRSIDVIADAILNITKSYNITSLYVAAPPYPHKMIGFLKQRIPTIKTEDDIILPDKMNKYKEDNYVWSLIEQEFTEKADLFLSSTGSNWSDFVTFFRSAMNKPSFRVKTLPGVEQATPDINI
uniref:peptide-O-fucosyltransferase n=1 Tax=Saccoglossus kowalevskii TaxID=10224 RepID=A0ABM0MPF1_SACKO|nr:PREDICTED: uncharacterized protein LOC100373382 [Saccoglossus kowalevskii]